MTRKFLTPKKSTIDGLKTASEKALQNTAETTEDLLGKQIADKIKRTATLKSARRPREYYIPSKKMTINY